MTKEELKQYLKDNLKLTWHYQGDELFLMILLEYEVISKVRFEQY